MQFNKCNNMKEIKLNIKMNEDLTANVKGILDAIIVFFPVMSTLEIWSELGYLIYKEIDIQGVQYIPIRSEVYNPTGQLFNYQSTKFNLDENVIIRISPKELGQVNEVKMVIRYD